MANAQIVVTANTRQAEAALGRLNRSLGGISSTATLVGTALAGIVTGGFLRSIVQTTARFQDLRTTLASATGSAREGAKAFDFITQFATRTQFGVEDLTQTYIKLQTAGITPTQELLTTFTDAAAVTTDQLGSLQAITDLFSRTTAGGLGLEELNRLADRGIPVFDILQEKLGRNRLQLSDLGKTAEGANLILRALTDGINERFGGATAGRINNLSTQMSNLQIAITNAKDAIGRQGFALALGETVTEITNLITNNEVLVKSIGRNLTKAFLYAKAAMVLVIQNIELIGKAFIAFFALKIGLAIGGIVIALARGLYPALLLAASGVQYLTRAIRRNPLLAIGGAIAIGIAEATGALDKLFGKLQDLGAEAIAGAGERLVTGLNGVLESTGLNIQGMDEFRTSISGVNDEVTRLQNQANELNDTIGQGGDAVNGTNQELLDQANLLGEVKKTFQEIINAANRNVRLAEIANETSEIRRGLLTAELDLQRQLTDQERTQLELALQNLQAQKEQLAQAKLDRLMRGQPDPMERADQINAAVGIVGRLDPRLAQEQAYQTEMAALKAAEFANEADRKRLMERLEQEHQQKLHEIKKQRMAADLQAAGVTNQGILDAVSKSQDNIRLMEQGGVQAAMGAVDQLGYIFGQLGTFNKDAFRAAKAFNIANAIMNTYMGATKALATYPPPFNFIMAAAVVASGLAQVAQIRSQQFSGRALGGPVMAGQSYIVGESSPEVFTPTTNGRINRMDQMGGGDVSVNFTIVANDTTGFDELLTSRQGLIRTIISDAMLERGNRSMV